MNATQILKVVFLPVENIVGQGENAVLLFQGRRKSRLSGKELH